MRKLGAAFIVCALSFPLVGTVASAQDSDTAAEKAAREIADARDRANAAADAWAAAESRLDGLELERAQVEREIAALQEQVDVLRDEVKEIAVQQFIHAGSRGVPMLTGFEGAADAAQADVLIGLVNESAAVTFDDYDEANKTLEQKKRQLERTTTEVEDAADALVRTQAALEAEIERLKATEAKRLQDEAVRKALEAEEAERRRKEQEAAEKAAAEAAAAAAARAREQAAASAASAANSASAANAGPANAGPSGGGAAAGSASTPTTSAPSRSESDRPSGSGSGGTTGGTTGGGGNGGLNSSVIVGQDQDWVCPVNGPRAFADTFGAPRSGGRQHQGVDIINPRGTPIVAVVDGVVQQRQNALGGNALWLTGNDGNKYYYAHLDSYGAAGPVGKGETIGFNGDTGNATGTPHLHFEIHPGGGAAINPYPTVRAHC